MTALAPYLDKQAWLEERNPKIGATDVAAILGRDEFDPGGQKLWDRIVLGITEENLEKSGDIRRGQKFEPVAADTLVERSGLRIRRHPMRVHPLYPFFVADVDRLIETPREWPDFLAAGMDPQEGPGACEIKVPRISNFYRMKEEGLPLRYVIQHQAQFSVTGWKWGIFEFYTPEYDDMIWFPVLRDDAFIAVMEERIALWWENHVEGQLRPERPMSDPPRWPEKPTGEADLRADPAWEQAAEYYREAEYLTEQARIKAEAAEENLLHLLGEDEQYVAGAGVRVKRYSTTPQNRTDWKAFRAAVKLAQENGDTERLLSLDPDDDEFKYLTNTSEKVDIKVTAPKEEEVAA